MNTDNPSENACPTCGVPIPDGAPGGLCPACVLKDSQTAVDQSAAAAPSVEQIAGAFPEMEIVELVGRGGMGAVYHARQPKLDRDLALKVLLPDLASDPAFEERFSREARALAKLNHPNIVAVYDFGERDGLFYLAMEYVDGVNLRQAMAASRFTPQQALDVVPGICDALGAAHELGILHRDIKPENILLDREGKVKIVDFGIARIVGDAGSDFTLTEAGAVLGSRQYMAPEQLERSHEVDERADIYSLGVVFYELLTGELPIGRFLPPSGKSESNPDIDAIVMRALEKELDRRFQNVGQVKTEVGTASSRSGPPIRPTKAIPVSLSDPPTHIAGVPHFVLWALGLMTAALVLATYAHMAYRPFREPFGGLILTVAFIVGMLGYAASWLGLKAMRRREIAPVGKRWLQFIAIAPPVIVVAWFATKFGVLVHMDSSERTIFPVMLWAIVPTYLIACGCVRWSRFRVHNPRAKLWAWRFLGVFMAAFSVLAAKNDGRWPYAHAKVSGHMVIGGSSTGKNPEFRAEAERHLQAAVLELNEEVQRSYEISLNGSRLDVTALTSNNSERDARGHVAALFGRVLSAMPDEFTQDPKFKYDLKPQIGSSRRISGHERHNLKRSLTCYGLAAAIAATGCALLGSWAGFLGFASMVFAFVIINFVPLEPYPNDGPQPVYDEPLPQVSKPPLELDFSTPEAAARSFFKALTRGDEEARLKCFAKTQWRGKTPEPGYPQNIARMQSGGRVAKLTRIERPGLADNIVMLEIVIERYGGTHRPMQYGFLLEEEEWKLTSK